MPRRFACGTWRRNKRRRSWRWNGSRGKAWRSVSPRPCRRRPTCRQSPATSARPWRRRTTSACARPPAPSQIRRSDAGRLKLDFTGVETGNVPPPPASAELEASCRAPKLEAGGPADAAADLYALGAILDWLLRGRPGLPGHSPPDFARNFEQQTRAFRASWQHFVPLLLSADPAHRPSAQSLLPRLQGDAADPADAPAPTPWPGRRCPQGSGGTRRRNGSGAAHPGEAGRGRHGHGLPRKTRPTARWWP